MDSQKSRQTIENLRKIHEESLILNPTENIPFCSDVNLDFLEGMYISEEMRNENSKVIFAGRGNLNELYDFWCKYMNAKAVTFKPHFRDAQNVWVKLFNIQICNIFLKIQRDAC